MAANISHFEPDTSVKMVMVYLQGTFPPKRGFFVEKDLNLPTRLYPNAKFLIRCNLGDSGFSKNKLFFLRLFKGRQFKLIPDTATYDDANISDKIDVFWFIHFNFIFFGGKIDKYTFDKWSLIQNTKSKVHILFNEEGTKTFEPLYDYVQRRNENFSDLNNDMVDSLEDKTDWSNITLHGNEDRIKQWVNDRPIQKCLDGGINISYLTDKILYDLPDATTIEPHVNDCHYPNGVYIGKFSDKRLAYFNKKFICDKLVMNMYGPGSDELKYHRGDGKSIDNVKAKEMLSSGMYNFSIYIGKGTPSLYLGATFYEPLLNGLPVFIANITDPEHKIFPGLDCYFDDEVDLYNKLQNYRHHHYLQLLGQQIKTIL